MWIRKAENGLYSKEKEKEKNNICCRCTYSHHRRHHHQAIRHCRKKGKSVHTHTSTK